MSCRNLTVQFPELAVNPFYITTVRQHYQPLTSFVRGTLLVSNIARADDGDAMR